MDQVTLKSGEVVAQPAVLTTMEKLATLAATDFITLIELVSTCRDRSHKLYGDTGAKLVGLAMLESVTTSGHGKVHDVVRAIVLSATEGEDFDLKITWPIAA